MDYKNADKKALKENLKSTIQNLLREGIYDEGMAAQQEPQQQSGDPVQKAESLSQIVDYNQFMDVLREVVANSTPRNNTQLREALLQEFQEMGGKGIKVTKDSVNVKNLFPTQNEIGADDSLGFLFSHPNLVKGNVDMAFSGQPVEINKTPIIVYGNYIIDGHHRWSQVYLLNPNATMTAYKIQGGPGSAEKMLALTQVTIGDMALNNKRIPSSSKSGINILQGNGYAVMSAYLKQNITQEFINALYPYISKNSNVYKKQAFNPTTSSLAQNNKSVDPATGINYQGKEGNFFKESYIREDMQPATAATNNGGAVAPNNGGAAAPNNGGAAVPNNGRAAYTAPATQTNNFAADTTPSGACIDYCSKNAASINKPQGQSIPRSNMPQTDSKEIGGSVDTTMSNLQRMGNQVEMQNIDQETGQVWRESKEKKNNNMRLTESQLRQIVRESAKKVLSEINKEYEDMHKAKAYDDYLGQNMLKRGWDIVTGKRPEKPYPYTPNEPMSTRAQRYVDAFNQSHRLGNRVDYDNGESYNSRMNWSDDPENRYEPVLSQTTFDGSTVAQQRKAYDEAGNEKEWGIEYPYSEMGYTGEYEGDNDDIKRRSADFKKLRGEVSGKLAASKRERDSKNSGKSKKNESVVRMTQGDFQKFISESVKNVIKEMYDNDGFDGGMSKDWSDRIGKRYAEKAKYGYGNLDEGPWEDDGEFEMARARVKGAGYRKGLEDHMNEMDEYEASWDTLKKNPDYNSGGMGPAYQKYGIPDDVLYGDR